MRHSKNTHKILLVMSLGAVLHLCGCGRNQTSPLTEAGENSPAPSLAKPAEFPLNQQTEQKLDPLTQEDVDLYLRVMQAAAARVKNPLPEDKSTLDRAKKILAGGADGRIPTPDDVKTLERATLVAISMDQIVAEEMKLDGRTYRGIVEAVESVVPDPFAVKPVGDAKPVLPDHDSTPLLKRLEEANAANEKFLMPYRDEIRSLITIVRNPGNLPK